MQDKDPKLQDVEPQVQIVWRDAVDNLRFLKRQQWIVTNYLVILYAAVYAIDTKLSSGSVYFTFFAPQQAFEKIILTLLLVGAFCLHWRVLGKMQGSIEKYRWRLAWFNKTYFDDVLRVAIDLSSEPKPPSHDRIVTLSLKAVAWAGVLMVLYTLWRKCIVIQVVWDAGPGYVRSCPL